jgi:hypothetical protein
MDEWQLEMREIQRNSASEDSHGDPVTIDEPAGELRILESVYNTTWDVFEAGEGDAQTRRVSHSWGWGTGLSPTPAPTSTWGRRLEVRPLTMQANRNLT